MPRARPGEAGRDDAAPRIGQGDGARPSGAAPPPRSTRQERVANTGASGAGAARSRTLRGSRRTSSACSSPASGRPGHSRGRPGPGRSEPDPGRFARQERREARFAVEARSDLGRGGRRQRCRRQGGWQERNAAGRMGAAGGTPSAVAMRGFHASRAGSTLPPRRPPRRLPHRGHGWARRAPPGAWHDACEPVAQSDACGACSRPRRQQDGRHGPTGGEDGHDHSSHRAHVGHRGRRGCRRAARLRARPRARGARRRRDRRADARPREPPQPRHPERHPQHA